MAINSPKRRRKKFRAVARALLILLAVVAASCTQPADETPPDTTAPTVSVSSTASNPTSTDLIPVTITFSEVVTGFDAGDLIATNATAGNFDDSNNPIFTVDLHPSVPGEVTLDIAAGVCTDGAGNPNEGLASTFSRNYSP